jgi:hypothetical protein
MHLFGLCRLRGSVGLNQRRLSIVRWGRTVVLQQFTIRAPTMEQLEFLKETPWCASQTLGNLGRPSFGKMLGVVEKCNNLLLPQRVILESLGRFQDVRVGSEDIVQPKLCWEDVHGNLDRVRVTLFSRILRPVIL